jgi:hypothetical protein
MTSVGFEITTPAFERAENSSFFRSIGHCDGRTFFYLLEVLTAIILKNGLPHFGAVEAASEVQIPI